MSFICQQHLKEYKQTPQLALSSWNNFIKDGQFALSEGELNKALICIGSAFDIAQILLNQARDQHCLTALDRFIFTGEMLMHLYDQLKEEEQAKNLCIAIYCYLTECHDCLFKYPKKQRAVFQYMNNCFDRLNHYFLIH